MNPSTQEPAPKHSSTQATREPLHLRSDGQRANPRRDVGEHRGKLGTDNAGRTDDHDRDESGDQAILNGGDARLVSEETREESLHRKDPFAG